MMTSKVYFKILLIFLISFQTISSQDIYSGYVLDIQTNETISDVKIYSKSKGLIGISDNNGFYKFESKTQILKIDI